MFQVAQHLLDLLQQGWSSKGFEQMPIYQIALHELAAGRLSGHDHDGYLVATMQIVEQAHGLGVRKVQVQKDQVWMRLANALQAVLLANRFQDLESEWLQVGTDELSYPPVALDRQYTTSHNTAILAQYSLEGHKSPTDIH